MALRLEGCLCTHSTVPRCTHSTVPNPCLSALTVPCLCTHSTVSLHSQYRVSVPEITCHELRFLRGFLAGIPNCPAKCGSSFCASAW